VGVSTHLWWIVAATQVHVYPLDHEKAKAMIAATHTKQPKEGTKSRKDRRLEQVSPRPPHCWLVLWGG